MGLKEMVMGNNKQPEAYGGIGSLCQLTPRQQEAHEASETYVLAGGGMGGGKSYWLCAEAIDHCLSHEKARAALCRNFVTSLLKTTMETLERLLPAEQLKKRNKREQYVEFKNGSRLYLIGLFDNSKIRSMELSWAGIDQAEEVTEDSFRMLATRLRLKGPWRYRLLCTANPTSNWVRRRWIEQSLPDHRFVQMLAAQNKHLDPGYIESMKALLPEEQFNSWLLGDWYSLASENVVFELADIEAAMSRTSHEGGDVCWGLDVGQGDAETVLTKRHGNTFSFELILREKDITKIVDEVSRKIGNKLSDVVVDAVGIGAGVADGLKKLGYRVVEFNGSEAPADKRMFKNRRAEATWRLKSLLPRLCLPNDAKLKSQMAAIRTVRTSTGQIQIESKELMSRRGLPSPDRLDAVTLACWPSLRITAKDMEPYLPRKSGDEYQNRLEREAREQKIEVEQRTPDEEMQDWMVKQGGTHIIRGSVAYPLPSPKRKQPKHRGVWGWLDRYIDGD